MGMRLSMRVLKKAVRLLSETPDRTYAQQSGIRLKDRPTPLFQLLVLALLASRPNTVDAAVRVARQLFRSGLRSPRAVIESDRRSVVASLDAMTAARLNAMATRVRDEFDGDLRNLGVRCGHDAGRVADEVQTFSGIDSSGADVFLREVQTVWRLLPPQAERWAVATGLDGRRAL